MFISMILTNFQTFGCLVRTEPIMINLEKNIDSTVEIFRGLSFSSRGSGKHYLYLIVQ